jgi:hypothetical protein
MRVVRSKALVDRHLGRDPHLGIERLQRLDVARQLVVDHTVCSPVACRRLM